MPVSSARAVGLVIGLGAAILAFAFAFGLTVALAATLGLIVAFVRALGFTVDAKEAGATLARTSEVARNNDAEIVRCLFMG